jgi:glutathione S-transferase
VTIQLWDLAGAEDDRRFSANCWRIRLALLHKGLAFETIPWRFTEKDRIAFSGQGKVPVIVDGGRIVSDSWVIAQYLDATYPDRPSILGGAMGTALSRFITDWGEIVVNGGIFPMIVLDLFGQVHAKDRAYFRASREERVGMTLEAFAANRESRLEGFRASLAPLRRMLKGQSFIAGERPAWADFAVFGGFQWARCVSPFQLLAQDDPVHAWRERMLDAFDGAARRAPGYSV